jgi:surface antigen
MKKVLINLAIATTTVSLALTGCSKNTQNENTATGAVTGGVLGGLAGSLVGGGTGRAVAIGVGIVGGALIGGYIGHNMDSTDHANMNKSMDNRTNEATTWKNEKTGATYTVIPTSKYMTVNGNPNCRKFVTIANINGKDKKVHGIACRQSDGSWKGLNP